MVVNLVMFATTCKHQKHQYIHIVNTILVYRKHYSQLHDLSLSAVVTSVSYTECTEHPERSVYSYRSNSLMMRRNACKCCQLVLMPCAFFTGVVMYAILYRVIGSNPSDVQPVRRNALLQSSPAVHPHQEPADWMWGL